MTNVKICGLTRSEDAECAVELGAWALGFLLWPGSPRYCPVDDVATIVAPLHRKVETVGVFVNQTLDEVAAAADVIGLSMIQLHGDEGLSYCDEVARRTGCKIVKAMRVQSHWSLQELRQFRGVDYHLVDSYQAGVPGGTGETFDWSLLRNYTDSNVPLLLSGGLTADNVAAALATVDPFAVDVSSGVEDAPGKKSHDKMTAFFRAVTQADGVVAR